MTWRLVVAGGCVAALWLVAPTPARAGSCGHSSGGGGSSSSSSSSSSSGGGGSSSSSSRPRCVEVSSVVGRQKCGRFGRWDARKLPPLVFGFGTSVHSLSLTGMSFSGTASHDTDIKYRMTGNQVSRGNKVTAATFDMRMGVIAPRPAGSLRWYVDSVMSAGMLSVSSSPVVMANSELSVKPKGGLLMQGGLAAGVVVPVTGKIDLRAELVGGGRLVALAVETQHADCVARSAPTTGSWLLQSRAGVTKWLSPHLGIGMLAGTNLLHQGDVQVGVFLQGHLRAYDGGR